MVDTPFVKQFRDEHVATFERRASLLRMTATTEAVIKGNEAEFLVAGSGGAKAVTRGSNGKIPFGSTTNTQNTVTLKEAHAPFERSGFNVFAAQGNQRRIMQEESVGTLNRDIDDTIIAELDTTTQNTGAAVTASLALVVKSQTILGNADVEVEDEDNMFCVATPAFRAYLMQIPEFSSADYMDVKIFAGPTVKMKRWAGCNWVFHTGLTGAGTNAEQCYMYHRRALGSAANAADMDVQVGYDAKQDMSWSRATLFHGAKLLQQTGIVKMNHDGSAYVAA